MEFTNKLIEKSQIAKICQRLDQQKENRVAMVFLIFPTLVINVILTRPKMRGHSYRADVDRHVIMVQMALFSKNRAEMVASLACVDFVVLNDESDAITRLETQSLTCILKVMNINLRS